MTDHALIPLGPIVRLQVQIDPLKRGEKPFQRYDPTNIREVPALAIEPHGVVGLLPDSDAVLNDVHHRDHPRSRFRGENGISLGFTAHYRAMRERFGAHVMDGIAGENILVATETPISIDDLAHGLMIGEGDEAVVIDAWAIAAPCAPFTKFCLGLPHDRKPDRRVTEALQFLDGGMRGFYGRYGDDRPTPARIALGAMVYRRG